MFSFKEIRYITDAFRAVIMPVISEVGLNSMQLKIIIIDNFTNQILFDEIVNSSLSEVIKFVENY